MKAFATDHALLRWMERQYGIDVDKYRRDLEAQVLPFVVAKAHYAPVGRLWAVLDGARVVTMRPNKPAPHISHKHDHDARNGTHLHNSRDAKFRKRRMGK